MDFSSLSKHGQDQTQAHQAERHAKAQQLYQAGLKYLQQARKDQFKDKLALKRAIQCFSKAAEHNRTDLQAYLQLGYISVVLRDAVTARRYLGEVLRLDPGNARAQKLILHLGKQHDAAGAPPLADAELASAPLKIRRLAGQEDSLFQRLEQAIAGIFQTAQAYANYVYPTANRQELSRFEQVRKVLEKQYDGICSQFETLDDELEQQVLERPLQSLEDQLNRIEDTCLFSRKLVYLTSLVSKETQAFHQKTGAFSRPYNLAAYQQIADLTHHLVAESEHWLRDWDELQAELDRHASPQSNLSDLTQCFVYLENILDQFAVFFQRAGLKPE